MKRLLLVVTLLLAAPLSVGTWAGCSEGDIEGEGPKSARASLVDDLALHAVDWNAGKDEVGKIEAVVEGAGEAILFGDKGATVMAAGAVRTIVQGVTAWTTATTLPASDGSGGTWVVGVSADGNLLRVRSTGLFEDIGGRYGLSTDVVRSVAAIDDKTIAFGVEGGIAIADGTEVKRFTGPAHGRITAGRGRVAWLEGNDVHAWNVTATANAHRVFTVNGARAVAIDAEGQLVVTAGRALWLENATSLALRWTADVELGSMTTAGSRVWITAGAELAVVDGEALARSVGAKLPADARLYGASTGEVWILAPQATENPVRKVSGTAASEAIADWEQTMKPLYARVCSACHAPGGTAGTDLSSYQAWIGTRAEIEKRVVIDKTMPPRTKPFSEEEREQIRLWLERNKI